MAILSPARSTYLLVCRDASSRLPRHLPPAAMGALLHNWLEWHDALQAAGQLRFCSAIEGESRSVSSRQSLLDRATAEQDEPVVGCLLIEAAGLDEAAEIARGCPGLNHGFVIEVYPPFAREGRPSSL